MYGALVSLPYYLRAKNYEQQLVNHALFVLPEPPSPPYHIKHYPPPQPSPPPSFPPPPPSPPWTTTQ